MLFSNKKIKMDFKEKHYKKNRFSEKKTLITDFKNKTVTRELEETKQMLTDFIDFKYQILKVNEKIIIPTENQITLIRTQSQLNLFTLFLRFIEEYEEIDFLSIQTYTFDENTILAIIRLVESRVIKKLQIIITETTSFRLPKIYLLLKDFALTNKNVNLVFYWIHSKVNLIKCKENYFMLDGSGNFSMNSKVEHYNIINSQNLFEEELKWQNNFFFGEKLRKNHEIFKNY